MSDLLNDPLMDVGEVPFPPLEDGASVVAEKEDGASVVAVKEDAAAVGEEKEEEAAPEEREEVRARARVLRGGFTSLVCGGCHP